MNIYMHFVCVRICVCRSKFASIVIAFAFGYILYTYVDVHMYICFC